MSSFDEIKGIHLIFPDKVGIHLNEGILLHILSRLLSIYYGTIIINLIINTLFQKRIPNPSMNLR